MIHIAHIDTMFYDIFNDNDNSSSGMNQHLPIHLLVVNI